MTTDPADIVPSGARSWGRQLTVWAGSDVPAVFEPDAGALTGAQLLAQASAAAAWLDGLGLASGTVVPALVTTGATAIALSIAGALSHRPLAPLGPRLTEHELAACVERLDCPVLVTQPAHSALARAVARRTGRQVAEMPDLAALPPAGRALDFDPPPDQVAFVVHTSGTSGLPKAVPVSQRAVVARNDLICGMEGIGRGAVFASGSPFHHVAGIGMTAGALGTGAAVVPIAQFSIDAWRGLGRFGVTHALVVPSMVDMLLAAGALRCSQALRVLQYGAAKMDVRTLLEAFDALPGVAIVQLYGQTEGSPITWLTVADHARALKGEAHLLESVGRAVPGLELRIDTPDAEGIGEVWARAPHMLVTDAAGWLHTGDLGRLDAEGFLYLAGRQGDMIIRGGENIHPVEVEMLLVQHPQVREAAVVGVPDRRWGETVKAFVVPADPAAPPTAEALHAFARERLAGFKVPAAWEMLAELPRNGAGKVLRRVLRGSRPA